MARHWSKNLSKRLALKSGEQLVTLRDAGDCLVQIFGTVIKSAPLEYAGELLIRAAETGKRADIKAASRAAWRRPRAPRDNVGRPRR